MSLDVILLETTARITKFNLNIVQALYLVYFKKYFYAHDDA